MSPATSDRFLKYLHPAYAAGALLAIYRENQQRDAAGTAEFPANADAWTNHEPVRQEVHCRAALAWAELTGLHHSCFPYSVSACAVLYMRLRKRNSDQSERFEKNVADLLHRLGRCANDD